MGERWKDRRSLSPTEGDIFRDVVFAHENEPELCTLIPFGQLITRSRHHHEGCFLLCCPQEELCVGAALGFWVERATAQQQGKAQWCSGSGTPRKRKETPGVEHQEQKTEGQSLE